MNGLSVPLISNKLHVVVALSRHFQEVLGIDGQPEECAVIIGNWFQRGGVVQLVRPSGEPSGFRMNRASRTGPLAVTTEGTELIAPSKFASATCGLGIGFCGLAKPGLLPPMAGWVWHIVQLFPLNVGPNPPLSSPSTSPDTDCTSWNRRNAWLKKACSLAFRVGKAPPAPGKSPRGPRSC